MKQALIAKHLLFLTTLFHVTLLSASSPSQLEQFLDQEPALIDTKSDDFITKDKRLFFKWNSEKKQTARAPAYSNTPKMSFWGFRVWECLVRFDNDVFSQMDIYLYNRGDAGKIERSDFLKLLKSITTKINDWSNTKGSKISRKKVNRQFHYLKSWSKTPYKVNLTYSYYGKRKKFKAEYIKLEIENPAKASKKQEIKHSKKRNKKGSLLQNVKKEENSDIYLDNIPMVDQGQKGYCAVATAERVIRYYGIDISQHQVAQIANSSASRGTRRDDMLKALKKAGTKFRIKVKSLYEGNNFNSWANFKRFIGKYNKFAKKAKSPTFNPKSAVTGNVFSPLKFFAIAEYDTLKKFKVKGEKRGFKNFKKDIKKQIDKGIPLIWSILTGLYQEAGIPQQNLAGHMRLIIGYNFKEKYLIYSDSWGQGHEKKTMPLVDAWTITTSLSYLQPRDK